MVNGISLVITLCQRWIPTGISRCHFTQGGYRYESFGQDCLAIKGKRMKKPQVIMLTIAIIALGCQGDEREVGSSKAFLDSARRIEFEGVLVEEIIKPFRLNGVYPESSSDLCKRFKVKEIVFKSHNGKYEKSPCTAITLRIEERKGKKLRYSYNADSIGSGQIWIDPDNG